MSANACYRPVPAARMGLMSVRLRSGMSRSRMTNHQSVVADGPTCDVLGKTLLLRGKERVHGNQVTLEPGIPKYRADALEFAPCGIVSVALQAEGEHTAARRE